MRHLLLPFAFLSLAAFAPAQEKNVDVAPLRKWVDQQRDVRTISADFVQTRRLRVLRDPVSRPGRIWFSPPGRFRWELGRPPETIVLRRDRQAFLISVKKKEARAFPPDQVAEKNGMQDLPAMEFPMAVDYADFAARFDVLAVEVAGGRCDADILPRDAQAQKFLKRIRISFDVTTGQLLAFEVASRDGSVLRNEFSNVRLNGKIDPSVFDFDFTGYRVTDANP